MSISFDNLRRANDKRQQEWPGNDQADVAFRTIEVAGEAGELAEAVKKFLRNQRGIKGTTVELDDIEDEMGDLVVSLDLLASELGINLGMAVMNKFNKTSRKYDMRTLLLTTS